MTKQGLEKGLVALLFVMVLVVFSLAERDSKKIQRLYTTVRVLKKATQHPSDFATKSSRKENSSN